MDKPKITFADSDRGPVAEINGLPLTVSQATSDLLAAIHFGHVQAIEMFKAVTQPAPLVPSQVVMPDMNRDDEDELGPGVIDMRSIWQMSPTAREAILSRFGLQVQAPEPQETDPTHATITELTGQAPATIKESED